MIVNDGAMSQRISERGVSYIQNVLFYICDETRRAPARKAGQAA